MGFDKCVQPWKPHVLLLKGVTQAAESREAWKGQKWLQRDWLAATGMAQVKGGRPGVVRRLGWLRSVFLKAELRDLLMCGMQGVRGTRVTMMSWEDGGTEEEKGQQRKSQVLV